MQSFHSFKVAKPLDLSSQLDSLVDQLFITFGFQSWSSQLVSQWVLIVLSFWLNSTSSQLSLIFGSSYKSNSCPVFLSKLSLVKRFADDLLICGIPDFFMFMYLEEFFLAVVYSLSFDDIHCTGNGFSCN